ncbi:hypothetical protein B0T17DRAFT_505749 [Bombardia bombarda]|uniref:Uncharacterized protein n=1 Tax=Bombardia bombarda TaxID=252184 RepID=A0AA39X8A7_9PEZI|nr:hypothetical protein B0T17DRAFT_505749 [Bombardia bombarda]
MAAPLLSKQPSGLSPDMVYRPLTPPAASYVRRDTIDAENDGSWNLRVNPLWILRVIVAVLSLASTIVWGTIGKFTITFTVVLIMIVELLYVLWCLGRLWPQSKRKEPDSSVSIPTLISFQIGECTCSYGGDDGGDDDGRKKSKPIPLHSLVDISVGTAIMVLTGITEGNADWWRRINMKAPVIVDYVLGTFVFKIGVSIDRADKPSNSYIRLAPDVDTHRTPRGVSVAA